MEEVRFFFEHLGFKFGEDLNQSPAAQYIKSEELSKTLSENLFFYQSSSQNNTSFYLLTTSLDKKNLDQLRALLWNKNDADLLFVPESNGLFTEIKLYYAKTAPNRTLSLDTFKISGEEEEKLDEIKKWRFDSGAFWLKYIESLKKHKAKSIDKELVKALYALKKNLEKVPRLQDKSDIVQALIDRTLYIKYLEDNHIINSYFYKHYFKNKDIDYVALLNEHNVEEINRLYGIINRLFNNDLFDRPNIENYYFTKQVSNLIYQALSGTNLNTGQLSLYEFKFNIMPIELVSYIYEVFLSDIQKKNGIYYTPKKLAQLIVDDVITEGEKGTVLDPACGSGMFLSVALTRLIENTETKTGRSVDKEIEHRLKLLRNYIFGIEKQEVARRFTVFSLSLQIFRGLDPKKIRDYIVNQIKEHGEVTIFRDNSFHQNILCQNTLSIDNPPFRNLKFDYIVGNPPFFPIPQKDEFKEELAFLSDYKISTISHNENTAGHIVGDSQISQCFLLKIKDWATQQTRFGFVSNSSSFYNKNSDRFLNFFYTHYGLEKIYELSRVKDILFENATEDVMALIFNNSPNNADTISYFPLNMELFSEKPFELLIVKEDKSIKLKQRDLATKTIELRDYLLGNDWDRLIFKLLEGCKKIGEFIDDVLGIKQGFQIWGQDARRKEFNLIESDWQNFGDEKKEKFQIDFLTTHLKNRNTLKHNKKYVRHSELKAFKSPSNEFYISSIENFHRPRNPEIYIGPRIIFSRIGNRLNALYTKEELYFDFDLYTFRLKEPKFYLLFAALLNSEIVNYFLNLFLRKRAESSYPKIGIEDMLQIPIPTNFDEDLIMEISNISKKLTNGTLEYTGKVADELNELIYDLYDLSYTERQRVKDYFAPNIELHKRIPEEYKESLIDSIEMYLKKGLKKEDIEFSDEIFKLRVAKISLNGHRQTNPSVRHTGYYMLNEIFKQSPHTNYIASQEKIWGIDCVYIIRKNEAKEWSQTKAYEDGQEILKRLRK